MPPKQDAVDLAKSDVTVLCNILMSVPDLKIDHKGLAPILGLSSAKNVLNVRLKPYGFEYKSGSIFQISQEPATSANDEDGESSGAAASAVDTKAPKSPKTPKTSKVPKAPKTPKTSKGAKGAKTPASKKRKLEEAAEESDDAPDAADIAEAADAADAAVASDAVVKDEGNNSDVED